jgi:hypothetical protein
LTTLAYLDGQIDEWERLDPAEVNVKMYLDLLKRRESQVRVSLTQATKMRLTQQSRYGARPAATEAEKPTAPGRVWEFK